jgi:hypothetical protein
MQTILLSSEEVAKRAYQGGIRQKVETGEILAKWSSSKLKQVNMKSIKPGYRQLKTFR